MVGDGFLFIPSSETSQGGREMNKILRVPTVTECLEQLVITEQAIFDAKERLAEETPDAYNEVERHEWKLQLWRARLELAREQERK